ncbi:MAG: NUDIX domain-containing protein, partial [Candidatus Aenigmarchaeota archaeon]|nr:NUDIX domain-containing protein [Candidatus Aenigmarchaeota archaeon]
TRMSIELQIGVKILLKNRDGKYLLLKRSSEKYPEAGGTWDIVGGRIDAGSGLMVNLRREVLEETGLEITEEPRLVGAQDILRIMGYSRRQSLEF